MRSLGDIMRGPARRARPCCALFPEAEAAGRIVEGVLRVPPRPGTPIPRLSETAAEGPFAGRRLLAGRGWETPDLLRRAAAARAALVRARVGGCWWADTDASVLPGRGAFVFIEAGDGREIGAAMLPAMLEKALARHPPERIVILAGIAAKANGIPALSAAAGRGVTVIGSQLDPWLLLDRAEAIYTAGGDLGLLGMLAGVPVAAFRDAAYTGWGVTDDMPNLQRHPSGRSADEIFAGICLVATRYRDPFHNRRTEFEDALAIAAEWRRAELANRRIGVCVGMSFWKRARIAEFVRSAEGIPPFRQTAGEAVALARSQGGGAPPGAIAGWASRLPPGLPEAAAAAGVPLIRVEDGFIRSVGLGSDFLPPASLVFDTRGMYFDPSVPSDLEIILREAAFDAPLLERARLLAQRLVARGVTKYNLAGEVPQVELPPGRCCILVPGQVEDDLSILRGGGAVRTNLGLIAATRAANPDAYILYKPHPDVLAGHRVGAVADAEALHYADAIAPPVSTAALLDRIDELHTMTSLAGFEALLRGRKVVVHGRPFYAGWGLTEDIQPIDRGRRLALDELVAGTLILYPRYLDPLTRLPCGPEVIIERLDDPSLWRPGPLVLARRLQGMIARRLNEVRAMLPVTGSGQVRGLKERPRS